ncbi:DUF3153 domain-containing protein [Candidatus Cyanaurora vandensis]|uniref:DUF3153 domain-containing protein n=1 Tax=Candidatus Cyanaurora vandensis TaxID=2714958 RepID=UPI00257FD1D9|nr:DUF3153 domain-containing protein [Candidatus Cyanaurora vandensis]
MKPLLHKSLGFLVLLLTLTGCVNYRLGLELGWDGSGTIIQQLQVDPFLASLARANIADLKEQVQERAARAGGYLDRQEDPRILQVVIPFRELQQVEGKLGQFFGDTAQSSAGSSSTVRSTIQSFQLEEQNFFVVKLYKLNGVLDLTNLARLPLSNGALTFQADGLINCELAITLPFAALSTNATRTTGNTLIWVIQPDAPNPLSLSFLLPNIPGLMVLCVLALGAVLVLGLRR